ncbi:DUF3040 domain-containing protein [Pseudonocardia acaciae]|uniref:DUF3040 domain-containing protein n=1 Tax=Pseudonocardia acaciae TaxID=551276 RepID=UPI00048CE0A2|nr:DUF3040 domain-containing protein [Pseudonocardia acaciae]
MLSERERRTLREIEERLAEEDQRFAEVMNRPLTGRASRWLRYGYDATIVLAGLLAVTCLAVTPGRTAGAGVVAALLAVGVFILRRRRFSQPASG